MTAEFVTGLLGVFVSLLGVAAFVWAYRHRQLDTDDQEMYEAVADDEPDFGSAAMPVRAPRRARWFFVAALISVFGLIGWMVWQTVAVVTRPVARPAAAPSNPGLQR